MDIVRIFAAATVAEWLPQRVLEFSIRENTSCPIEFRPLYTIQRPFTLPKDQKNHPRTPFSFQRFLIPEVCAYQGKAIYMDADMQVFNDINALWSTPMRGLSLQTVPATSDGRKGQFSVMLLDCEALPWKLEAIVADLDSGKLTYEQLMYEMRLAPSIGYDIPVSWNMLERYTTDTSLLHYTDMNTQPWVSVENPLGELWVCCLRRAIDQGFISLDELRREVTAGHVRPSLLVQIESGIDNPMTLDRITRRMDKQFIPPYKRLHRHRARPWTSPGAFCGAVFKSLKVKTGLFGR